ncbi:unnamed protein product, partial [Rhizoctonia solani]
PRTITKVIKEMTPEEEARLKRVAQRPPLSECLNLHDFEGIARAVMPEKAWAYYSSAADDEITHRENHAAYQRIWFRPRVLRDVTKVDWSTTILGQKSSMPHRENHAAYQRIWFRPRVLRDVTKVDWSTTILGQKSSMPVYITATALGKLGHPEGELNLTRAAAKHGVIQMIPTLASCSFDEIMDAAAPDQVQFMQLYVNKDRAITKRIVQHAEERGIKGLFITVDAPQLGRREKDMRQKFEDEGSEVQRGAAGVDRSQGAARAISSFIDPGLSWRDLDWFRSITKMPIVLKGVQCWEDAVLAAECGCAGIVLSNHGGRQLDTSRSGIEVLEEVVTALRERGLFPNPNFEIYVDGGVRRATDVLKAIAMGATAVGVGRPFIYAYSAYGQEGVEAALQILHDEFEMNLRLLGAPTIKDVVPAMVDTSSLKSHIVAVPHDSLYHTNCKPPTLDQIT